MKRIAAAALFGILLSCKDSVGPERRITDFDAAHQRWEAQNLHMYAYTLNRACFCGNTHPLYVLVLKDTVGGVFDLTTGDWVDRSLGLTVEDLFTFIHSATERRVQLIRAEYDGNRGFPAEIDYDGAAQIADDELSYRVSNVHPVTPQVGALVPRAR